MTRISFHFPRSDFRISSLGRVLPALLVSLLAGCASAPPAPSTGWETRRGVLEALQEWELKGRIAFQFEKDAWSATLHWRQAREDYALRLIAPFGKGTWELTGSGTGVKLRTADNRVLEAGEPRELLVQNLGWDIPVSGLRYWVRGLPEPGGSAPEIEFDDAGRIRTLRQAGWEVEYQAYRTAGDVDLPAKMSLRNDRLKVRLSLSNWKFPA